MRQRLQGGGGGCAEVRPNSDDIVDGGRWGRERGLCRKSLNQGAREADYKMYVEKANFLFQASCTPPPPLPCPNMGQVLVQGAKMNTKSPCVDKPVLPHSTNHGTHVADIRQLCLSENDSTKHLFMCTTQVPLNCLHSDGQAPNRTPCQPCASS